MLYELVCCNVSFPDLFSHLSLDLPRSRTSSVICKMGDQGTEIRDKSAAAGAVVQPQVLLNNVREEKAAMLSRQAAATSTLTVDHLIRLVAALITTNEEIWERCKGSCINEPNTYKRHVFQSVRVFTPAGGLLKFNATAKTEVKTFAIPTMGSLPKDISSLFVVSPRLDETKLPDYEKLLHSALLLHESLLIPFLNVLKVHLEDVQVHLGKVDTWLLEPNSVDSFLRDQFEIAHLPAVNNAVRSTGKTYNASDVCVICGEAYPNHTDTRSHGHYHTCSGSIYCPNNKKSTASFAGDVTVTLQTTDKKMGTHEQEFDITCEKTRAKLTKFLEFVSCY